MATSVPLREQQREFTRRRLMQAATEVFADNGYLPATVEDIAARAGASRATFYLHFKSKAAVVLALIEDAEPMAVERYRAFDALLSDAAGHTRAQMRAWLAEWLQVWRGNEQYNAALLQASTAEPEVEERLMQLSLGLVDTLEAYFSQWPEADRAQARERTFMLELMSQRLFYLAAHHGIPVDDDGVVDLLTDLWEQHFVAPPA
jgi:AcrR family transcriptional regulator